MESGLARSSASQTSLGKTRHLLALRAEQRASRPPQPPFWKSINSLNGPKMPDGKFIIGKLGSGPGQLNVEQGYQASRLAAVSLLSAIKTEIGGINKVKRVVKVLGMVNSDPVFTEQPKVINGASDLLVQVFGDCGKHARSAVGVSSLIFDIAVEIEMIVELR